MSAAAGAIAGNDLFTLFPTPVWIAQLDGASRDAMGEAIDAAVARHAAPAPGSDVARPPLAGLHRLPEMAPLVDLFVAQARDVLARLHVPHGPLEVTSSAAHTPSGGAAAPFGTIANAYLAGLYVARAPSEGCALEFEDPRAQAHIVAPPRTGPAPDAALARIERGAGALLVFPAWMRHRVAATGREPCTLVSLGLLFGEFADTIARPKWQGDAT